MKITVLIADDHRLIRDAWSAIIRSNEMYCVVSECRNGQEVIEAVDRSLPDIILMDINMPDMTGIEATRQILRRHSNARIIGVSSFTQTAYAKRMIQEGAIGYVTKTSSKEELFEAMQQALKNKRYLCRETKNQLADQAFDTIKQDIQSLSKREREIIQYLKQGKSSKEIADHLHVAMKTIEVHRYNILHKLNLKNTAALIHYIHTNALS